MYIYIYISSPGLNMDLADALTQSSGLNMDLANALTPSSGLNMDLANALTPSSGLNMDLADALTPSSNCAGGRQGSGQKPRVGMLILAIPRRS